MSTVAFRIVSGVCIVVHTAETPTDEEWDHYLDTALRRMAEIQGTFVVTYGGVPNAGQRHRAGKLWLSIRQRPPVAVLTRSSFARAIVNAMSWMARQRIQAFDEADVDGAFTYLGLAAEQRAAVSATVVTLKRTLGLVV